MASLFLSKIMSRYKVKRTRRGRRTKRTRARRGTTTTTRIRKSTRRKGKYTRGRGRVEKSRKMMRIKILVRKMKKRIKETAEGGVTEAGVTTGRGTGKVVELVKRGGSGGEG